MKFRKRPLSLMKSSKGFNLVELTMIMMVTALLAAFALISFGNSGERRDATMVQSAQASLQSVVSQGSVRMDVRPDQLPTAAVLMAIQATVGQQGSNDRGVTFTGAGNQYTMTISSTGRQALFQVNNNGDVKLTNLSNFSAYGVDAINGTIKKLP